MHRVDRVLGYVLFFGSGFAALVYQIVWQRLGALAAFVHPAPRTAAVIDLGSGDTLFGLAGRQTLDASHDRSTLVDINTDLHPKDEFALSLGSEG